MSDDRHSAFLDAVLPYVDVVYNVALRSTGDWHGAEDLAQETFLRAFAGFAKFRGGSMRAWLVAICLNTARSGFRRAQARRSEALVIDLVAEHPANIDVAEEALAMLERDKIGAALDALPEPQRVSIVLVDLAGLSTQEAADVLGCPRGTVLARVHRGRRRLAGLLGEVRHDA